MPTQNGYQDAGEVKTKENKLTDIPFNKIIILSSLVSCVVTTIILAAVFVAFKYHNAEPEQVITAKTMELDKLSEGYEVIIPEIEGAVKNSQGFNEILHEKDNSVMVNIPAGPFTMGSTKEDEGPVQRIFLDSYFIDKYLVTNEQFMEFIEETGYETIAEKEGKGYVRFPGRLEEETETSWGRPDGYIGIENKDDYLNHPVTQISFIDAKAYCKWAGKELPTEAQWEKAARGPEGNIYPWGDAQPDLKKANYIDAWREDTTPVTMYESGKSRYGLFDMAGNVYQWTRDWHGTGKRESENPAPLTGEERVLKGASFIDTADALRGAYRISETEEKSSNIYGCRCVKPSGI